MTIYTSIQLINDQYRVQVGPQAIIAGKSPFTAAELDVLARFGEPTVECGGEFDNEEGGDDAITFELADDDRSFPSQFPVVKFFDLNDDEDANEKAVFYRDTIKDRIEEAMSELRTEEFGTIGEEISNIDTNP